MKNIRLWLYTLAVVLLIGVMPVAAQVATPEATALSWPRTLTDGLGTEVTIAAPPQHIASVTIGSDEILLSLVDPSRILAVTKLSLDPGISNVAVPASQIPTTIAAASDTEAIIAMQPDIVFVASFTDPNVIQQLRDAGLTVFATGYPVGFDQVKDNIREMGQAVGAEDKAEALVQQMDDTIAQVSGAVVHDSAPRVLYLTPGNYTSGVNSTISQIIADAGGIDVAAAAGIDQTAPISDEFIIEQNPDVILLSGWTPYDPTFVDTFMHNPAFADLSAIKNQQVYIGDDAHLSAVSQYLSEGVKDVAAYLWPGEYPKFPITLTDTAGNLVTIPGEPQHVISADASSDTSLRLVANAIGSARFSLDFSDNASADKTAPDTVVFASEMDAYAGNAVILYAGTDAAETVANMLIIGDAIGERVAALNAVAQYTDQLEAQATPSS
jgi:cobalamin transport system substrate-binding protein